MSNAEREFVLTFQRDGGSSGRMPVALIARKLQAAQTTLYAIGASMVGGGSRGTFTGQVTQTCELVFVRSRSSDLQVVMELAPSPEPLFQNVDLGVQSLQKMSKTLEAISTQATPALVHLYPAVVNRRRVLRAAAGLLPEEEESYSMRFKAHGADVLLGSVLQQYVDDTAALGDDPQVGVHTIRGRLVEIRMDAGNRHLLVLAGGHRIRCDYEVEVDELVRDLMVGSTVEVRGAAELDENGETTKISEINDVRSFDLRPVHYNRIMHSSRAFSLKETIQVHVDFEDGVWIHEYEPLGIVAYGASRAESRGAFSDDFAACWDLIAREDDGRLTEDAQDLKRRLLALVEKVEEQP